MVLVQVYVAKQQDLTQQRDAVIQWIESKRSAASSRGTDTLMPGRPSGQLTETQGSLDPLSFPIDSADPTISTDEDTAVHVDKKAESSLLQDKVNEFISAFEALDPIWLNAVSGTPSGTVLADWLDGNMQFFTRALGTMFKNETSASCGSAGMMNAEQGPVAVTPSGNAKHGKRHTFQSVQSGTGPPKQ